jgi:hypothetical protein
MAIHNRNDFHAFSTLCGSDLCPAAFGHNEGRVNEAFFFIECRNHPNAGDNIPTTKADIRADLQGLCLFTRLA